MLRTLFQRSFLSKSRQSVMGLVAKRSLCTERQESTGTNICYHHIAEVCVRITSRRTVCMHMLWLMSSPFCWGTCWSPWPSLVSACQGPLSPPPVCGPNNTSNIPSRVKSHNNFTSQYSLHFTMWKNSNHHQQHFITCRYRCISSTYPQTLPCVFMSSLIGLKKPWEERKKERTASEQTKNNILH